MLSITAPFKSDAYLDEPKCGSSDFGVQKNPSRAAKAIVSHVIDPADCITDSPVLSCLIFRMFCWQLESVQAEQLLV